MNICFIGKHIYPRDIFSNEQDMKTWRSLSAYFDKLFIIAESPDLFSHKAREKNIWIYLLPRFTHIGFIKQSVLLGLYLSWSYGVDVFDASEVAGGGMAATILGFLTSKSTVIEIQGEIFRKTEYDKNFSVQGGPFSDLKSHLLQLIGRYVMKKAARVRVISYAIFNQVRDQGIPESKIRLVSLRVDLNLFYPLSHRSPTPESDSGEKVDKLWTTIGYVGRLVGGKGLEDLFEATAILKNQIPELVSPQEISHRERVWKIVIYGAGPLEGKLKKMASELRINDKIEWRGFVPYSKVPGALSQIDIFVYPSWHEGFGRSIMEALAMEKAVVATRVGGIPDLIKDGENGFLVKSHNPEALAIKIKELIEDKDLCERLGKAGRKFVSENFEWNDGIKKFANLFLELK